MKKIKLFITVIFDRAFWKTIKALIFVWYVKKFRAYYTDVNELPLYNFSKIINGNFEYLYKKKYKKYPKLYFYKIFENMIFQLKKIDTTILRLKADAAVYEANYVRTKNKRWLNELNTVKKKIEKIQADKSKFDLTDFLYFIENTLNYAPSSIDPKKISTAYAFRIFNDAVEKAKKNYHGNN